MESTTIRDLVETFYDSQKLRIATQNRIKARTDPQFKKDAEDIVKSLTDLEKTLTGYMANNLIKYDIAEWITAQKGLSTVLASGLISYIHPIDRFDNVSKLWAYCGYGVMDVCQDCGKRVVAIDQRGDWINRMANRLKEQADKKKNGQKPKSLDPYLKKADAMMCHCPDPEIKKVGQKRLAGALIDFNPRLKTICWKCSYQFMRQGDLYKDVYQKARFNYENRPDLKAEMKSRKGGISKGTGRIHAMAMRKSVKLFLSHLWVTWREQEGLSTSEPYAISVLGHGDYIPPPK